jgi:hypothetical protein
MFSDGTLPQISVILPAFNVADYIAASIGSLRAQSFTDFEAIVIDDGSDDATAAVAMAAIDHDPRFRLIRQANRGLSGARNAGLDLARAPVIGFLDADDRLEPDFLHILHADLQASGADWVACGIAFATPDGGLHPHSAIHGQPALADPGIARTFALSDWADIIAHFPSAWNKLYRRSLIGQTRFDEGLWFEDHTFFQRLAARSTALRHIPQPLYLYTLDRDGQITRSDSDRVFDQFTVLDHAAQIMRTSGKPGAEAGLARLATRLCLERLDAIRTPDRRTRFMTQAAGFFQRERLLPDWRWDPFLNALDAATLSGEPPVVLRLGAQGGDTGRLLPDPASPLARVFRLADRGQLIPTGALVLDLPGLVALDHAAVARVAHRLLQDGLDAAVLPLGAAADPAASGADLSTADLSTADLCARVLPTAFDPRPPQFAYLARAAFASRIDWDDPGLRLAEQTLRLADAMARVIKGPALPKPPAAATPPHPLSLRASLDAIDQWQPRPTAPALPPGWDRRLVLRAASARVHNVQRDPLHLRRRLRLLWPLVRLWWTCRQRGWIGSRGKIDADTPLVLRRLLRVPLSERPSDSTDRSADA